MCWFFCLSFWLCRNIFSCALLWLLCCFLLSLHKNSLFLWLGYYMRKSWSISCPKNLEKWQNCNHIYSGNRWHVWSEDYRCKWFAKTSTVASRRSAQPYAWSLCCSTTCEKVGNSNWNKVILFFFSFFGSSF